jgi:hypothetical protein|tara:strand:+ start:6104 stop:7750 length:1647 start_codon:yes stop_codon:yes gene_type:complete
MSFTYSYQTTLLSGSRVFDPKLKKVGAIQSVQYYDPVTYYQRLYGSWPNVNTDKITIRFDGEGSDTVYFGESCNDLILESASAGGAYDKLVLWYRFEETAGSSVGDWMYNVLGEGKPSGGAPTKLQTGVIGTGCINFNGTDQYLIGGITNIPNDKMSIAFWIKTSDTNSTILSFGGYTTNPVERAVKLSSGKINLYETDGASKTSTLLSSNTVNSGAWTHVVCTIGGIASIWKIYVNTTDVSASVVNGPNNTNLPIQKTTVGVTYTNNALSNYLTADIDDLRVYNNVLTQGEIDELYGMKPFSGTQTSAYSNINSWWRIEETSGTTLADEKSTNPATLYNASSFITFPSEGADSGSSSIKFDNTDMDSGTASQGFAQMGVAGITATDPFSISLWVKASVTRNCVIWAFNADNYGTTTRLWWLDIRSNGKVTFLTRNGNDTDTISSSSTNNNDGNWHHIVAVKTGNATSDSLKIYTDNVLRGTVALSNTGGYAWPLWNDFKFGVSKHYNGNVPSRVYNWWAKDVQIDDVRLYTSSLSNAQIAELYALAP